MNADTSDWPPGLRELQEIESMLKCPICYENLDTAVLAPRCSHTFCSLCIRRYLSYKTQCPTCSSPLVEPDLVTNRLVDNLVQQFKCLRSKLLQALKNSGPVACEDATEEPSDSRSIPPCSRQTEGRGPQAEAISVDRRSPAGKHNLRTNKASKASVDFFKGNSTKRSARHKSRQKYVDTDSEESEVVLSDDEKDVLYVPAETGDFMALRISPPKATRGPDLVCTPQRSTDSSLQPIHNSPQTPLSIQGSSSSLGSPGPSQSSQDSTTLSIPPSKPEIVRVPCPVCGVAVPQRNINLHLDSCLKGGDRAPARPPPPRRKTLPKLVYALMKDPQLRKCLGEAGLPTHGDRQAMIKRHHEYTLAYNAQCDSLNPKTAAEIAKEIKITEENRVKSSTTNSIKTKFFVPKGASAEEVEDAQKTYVKKHKGQFKQLIEEAKKRRLEKKMEEDSKTEISVSVSKLPESPSSDDHLGSDEIPSSQNVRRTKRYRDGGVDDTATAHLPLLINGDSKLSGDSDTCSPVIDANMFLKKNYVSRTISSSQSTLLTLPVLPSFSSKTSDLSIVPSHNIDESRELQRAVNHHRTLLNCNPTTATGPSDEEFDDSDRALLAAEASISECNGDRRLAAVISPKLNTDNEDTVPFSSHKTVKSTSLYDAGSDPLDEDDETPPLAFDDGDTQDMSGSDDEILGFRGNQDHATHDMSDSGSENGDATQAMSGSENEEATQAMSGSEYEDATQAMSGSENGDATQAMSGSENEAPSSPVCRPAHLPGSPVDVLFPSLSSKHDDSDSEASDILLDLSQCASTAAVPQAPVTPSSPSEQQVTNNADNHSDTTSPVFQPRATRKRRLSADNCSEEFVPKKKKSAGTKSKVKPVASRAEKPTPKNTADAEASHFSPRKTRRQLRSRKGN